MPLKSGSNKKTVGANTKKLELFARRSREGWDAWGNETTKFDKEGVINGI